MEIISYRGPGMGGGVSPALTRLVADQSLHHRWWYIDDSRIRCDIGNKTIAKQNIPNAVIEGHYRYCNELIWPVMHDLGAYATYRSEDRALYERFNRILARDILEGRTSHHNAPGKLFVQDYQLALLPKELIRMEGPGCGVFWHIPWPKSVQKEFLPAIIDLAKSLLCADFVGFHTAEYSENFLEFVCKFVPGANVALEKRLVSRTRKQTANRSHQSLYLVETNTRAHQNLTTRLITAPLGLDVSHWKDMAEGQSRTRLHPKVISTDYILSVDRADYTKGVLPRIEAINQFFANHPQMISKITFAQLVTRTRPGLEAFDRYWLDIQKACKEVNSRFATANWAPIHNLKGPINPNNLALLYGNAKMMLVNPLRDGLNLTAKEFVACQSDNPGVLALSSHAGAFQELATGAVEVDPFDTKKMSRSIFEALHMPVSERKERIERMDLALQGNRIIEWCDQFSQLLEPVSSDQVATAH